MEHTNDKYELVGENLTYNIADFNNKYINRYFTSGDTNDKLPNSSEFVSLFPEKQAKQIYEFSIYNSASGILILNPGDNMIFRDNIYILAPEEKKEFIACILSLEPCIIGIVTK